MTAPYQQPPYRPQYGAIVPPPNMDPMAQVPGQMPTPGATGTPFGPDQNLIGTQLNAQPGADTTAARGYVGQNLGALQGAPDRGMLAGQTFQQLTDASAPQYQQDLRAVGEKAAALGRIGSGVTTSELGDVALQRQKYLGNLASQLSTQSAGQSMQDRLNQLSAGQNVLGQFGGLDQQAYENTVGERGYQQGLSQQAFGNNLAQNQLLSSLGGFNSGDPGNTLSQAGAGNMAGGSALLQLLGQNRQGSRAQAYQYGAGDPYADNPNPGQRY